MKLNKQNELNETICWGANSAYWDWDYKSGHLDYSDNKAKFLGYEPEEIEPKVYAFTELIHPDDYENIMEKMAEHLNGFTPFYEVEYRIKAKNGDWKIFYDKGKVTEREINGRPVRIIGITNDITEKSRLTKELKFSENLLREIMERSADVFYRQDINTGKFDFVSSKSKNVLGFSPAEMKDLTYEAQKKYIHPEDFPKLMNFPRDLIAADKRGINSISREFRILFSSDRYKWVKGTYNLSKDSDGNPAYVVGSLRDITKRKEAEENLAKSEYNLRSLFNAMEDIVFEMDYNGTYINIAPTSPELMYKPAEEMAGKTLHYAFDKKTADKFLAFIRGCLDENKGKTIEYPLTINNKTLWFSGKATPKSANTVIYIAREITKKKEAEQQIKILNERIQIAVNAAGIGIWDLNLVTKHLIWDEWMYKIYGIHPDDFEGVFEAWQNVLHPDNFKSSNKEVKKAIEGNGEFDLEFRIIRPDGEIRYIKADGLVKYDESGKAVRMIGTNYDITERRIAQKELELREKHLTSLLENPSEYIIYRLQANKEQTKTDVVLVSPSFGEILDLPDEDCKDFAKWFKYVIPEDLPKLVEANRRGMSPPFKFHEILRYKHPENGLKWIEVRASGIPYEDEPEKIEYANGIIIDITNLKKAEERVKLLTHAIEQSPVSIIMTDSEGKIEYVNNGFEKVTQYKIDEVKGKSTSVLSSGNHPKAFYEDLWNTIKSGEIWSGEFHNRKKNGELYWENAVISPAPDENNNLTHFIAIKEDITERKKILNELIIAKEQAEKAERLKSEFLAQMSHEIRSPLNVINNFISLLEEETSGYGIKELETYFNSIEKSTKRIIRTIDLILNMSDLQLGTYTLSESKLDLKKFILRFCDEYSHSAQLKGLKILCKIDSDNFFVKTDEYALGQIMANLLDNAIKYSEKGEIEIVLSESEKGGLKLEVSDTGIGISDEYLPQIFTPFTQEEKGYTRKYDGTGLGLSLVKKYCDLIGADISVKSKKNEGTTFTILI